MNRFHVRSFIVPLRTEFSIVRILEFLKCHLYTFSSCQYILYKLMINNHTFFVEWIDSGS
jgi:hypothetical protein